MRQSLFSSLKKLQTPGVPALPCHSLITQQAEIQLDGATEYTIYVWAIFSQIRLKEKPALQ